jgi:hypothetical protein
MATVEKSAEYLAKVNWRTLMEWVTAEAILTRPTDPVIFCRDLLSIHVHKRAGGSRSLSILLRVCIYQGLLVAAGDSFAPEQITECLRQTYTDATALADENGIIRGKQIESTSDNETQRLRDRLQVIEKLLEASRAMSTKLDPIEATDNIIHQCCSVLAADRATIFTIDEHAHEVVLMVAHGARNIRMTIGQVPSVLGVVS